jgi:ribonuclease D
MFTLIDNLADFEYLDNEIESNKDVVGVDTEFRRTNKDNMKLGLLQIYDGEEIYLIDPVSIGPLEGGCHFLRSKRIIKIFHSFREDIESIYSWTGNLTNHIFDTQLAEAILGRDYSLSYQDLVMKMIEITLDKGETRSNWLRRPLTDSQLKYAALDVEYLIYIFKEQKKELLESNKYSWVIEEADFYAKNFSWRNKIEKTKRENLTKEDEKFLLNKINSLVIRLSNEHSVHPTILLSKKNQKDFIRIIFSKGLQASLELLSPWKRNLLEDSVKDLLKKY